MDGFPALIHDHSLTTTTSDSAKRGLSLRITLYHTSHTLHLYTFVRHVAIAIIYNTRCLNVYDTNSLGAT